MKAAQITEYGDVSVINVVEVEKPAVGAGRVLVKVKAASLNPFDSIIHLGYMQEMMPLEFPVTLGGDIAGEVVEVGEGVGNISVGDTIYGQANVVAGNSGAFAEYAATVATQVAKAPTNVDIQAAASLPLVGSSALQALVEHIQLSAGQKILITGGAGGIGQIAIQIAKHLGAYVATTVATSDVEHAKQLGADQVFDYKTEDYTESLSDFDAAFDTVGGEELKRIVSILKDGGVAVSMGGQPEEKAGVTSVAQMTHVTTEKLNQLRELVEADVVKPNVGKVFTLDEVREAFTAREAGTVSGKIVIEIE
jgi:NADPH:quinone reductase-like Zn-dependent oxidoreductase